MTGHHLGIPPTKDPILVAALPALIVGHILDYAQNTHPQILEHLDSLDHIDEGQPLRSGHDDCPVEVELLAETELDVASSRRHVHDQVVELAPVGLVEELRDDRRDNRSAHDGRFLPGKPKRHTLHSFIVDGLNLLLVVGMLLKGVALAVNKGGQGRSIYIGIEYADLIAFPLQGGSEVDCNRAFPDPALATAHCYDLLDTKQVAFAVELVLLGFRGEVDVYVSEPFTLQLALDQRLDSPEVLTEIKGDSHLAGLVDLVCGDHA